jgi:antitoxin component YwqK of YwqJK toxin-antitoxin module
MKILKLFILILLFFSCTENEDNNKNSDSTTISSSLPEDEDLIERMPNNYREYYPGKKQLKIAGGLDKDENRHGIWESYFENGVPNSTVYYMNGKKHGHTVVYYPNGNTYYVGEYENDERVGHWKFYNEVGELLKEEHF